MKELKVGSRVKVDFISESRTIYSGKRFTGIGLVDRIEDVRVFGHLDDGRPFMCFESDVEIIEMNKMTHEQFLLLKLAEEASEIAQIALKTAQFGMFEKHPEMELNNKERIHQELNDLLAVVDELNSWAKFDFKEDYAAKVNKIEKINRYLEYSINLGKVENVPKIFSTGEADENN